MSRINACLEQLKSEGRKALVPYIVAGDLQSEMTVPMMHALVKQGADIIELGVPFSDPMAEGPVIQVAHERALENNVSLTDVLAMVKVFRQKDEKTPVVLMGYANPVHKMGYENFATNASNAGVDGLLTVDLPPEEATPLNNALKSVKIDSIFLIAPTTTVERIKHIAELATGYLYYVSLKGVTGAGHLDVDSVREKMAEIRAITPLPVAVGFGIKDAESASQVSRLAEGVVVGSALVRRAAELFEKVAVDQAIEQSTQLIGEMRQAMDVA
ncbi:tryptophan synthase subunit alpha [bacterium]|nr:tryptophan synthase subunit alpha [bacterium]